METITELISQENKESNKPIPNKQDARKLILELKDVVSKYVNLPKEAVPIIDSKLSDLNKPTNRNKLLFPFHLFSLSVSKTDEEILSHRNSFLHGRSPVSHSETWKLEQIALKLHYLAGILILKYIGYGGHVMDLPAWALFNNQAKMEEAFPFANSERLNLIKKKVIDNIELSEEDCEVYLDSGRLSIFMENIIRLI